MKIQIKIPKLEIKLSNDLSIDELKIIIKSFSNIKTIDYCDKHNIALLDKKTYFFYQFDNCKPKLEYRPYCEKCFIHETSIYFCGGVAFHIYVIENDQIRSITHNGEIFIKYIPEDIKIICKALEENQMNSNALRELADYCEKFH
jgi:hypothetical protein